MQTHRLLSFFIFLFFLQTVHAQEADTLKKGRHVELSFGHSLLFISNSKLVDLHTQEAVVVPTSAVLLFAEFMPQKFVRVPLFVNISTETKQFLVDSVVVNEKSSPTVGTGVVFRALHFDIDEKSNIELEVGPLASVLFDENNSIRIAPVIAGRMRISRGENFVMYIGSSYSIGINAFGLLYGTGTTF